MKKYKYQCDNNDCRKKFVSLNPTNCPHCTSDDFTLIGEPSKLWIWVSLLTISLAAILMYINSSDEIIEISYTIVEKDNYIEINTPESYDFDNAQFVLTDQTNNQELYNEGNKFYPCDGSGIKISIEFSDTLLDGETIINHYRFPEDVKKNTEFCETLVTVNAPQFLSRGTKRDRTDCGITIYVDDSDGEVEYSIDKVDWIKGKDKWTYEELGTSKKIYIRFVGKTELNSVKIKKCKPKDPNDGSCKKKKELENLLINYFKDYKKNRSSVTNWLKENDCDQVKYYIDSDKIGGFQGLHSRVKIDNMNDIDVSNWKIKKIECSDNRIVKVIIKTN